MKFRVYIDESGDEGFVFHADGSGSSRWLVLSAAITRPADKLLPVALLDSVRATLGKAGRPQLHFAHLKHEQRVPYVRAIGESAVVTASVLVPKLAITQPDVFTSEKFRLYRYATRYLLERVSWFCRDSHAPGDPIQAAEIIFSNRACMSYDDLRDYLRRLRANGHVQIDWRVVNPDAVRAVDHAQLAGLQVADAVASGVRYAAELNRYGESEDRYLRLLAPTFYRRHAVLLGYGLKFWPADVTQLKPANPHLAVFAGL